MNDGRKRKVQPAITETLIATANGTGTVTVKVKVKKL